jgi:hypothetical protein
MRYAYSAGIIRAKKDEWNIPERDCCGEAVGKEKEMWEASEKKTNEAGAPTCL